MKIGIGSDHGGFILKEEIKKYLISLNYEVVDYGCNNTDSCDYPDYAKEVAKAVQDKSIERGILVCTTGIGMSISANRYQGVRASLVLNDDMCALTRKHNDSNILVLAAKYTTIEEAKKYIDIYFNTPFEGGRHERRINKIEKEN